MADALKIIRTNRLATSEHYSEILRLYNEHFTAQNGKVNDGKFYQEIVKPLLPTYSLFSWYQFLRRFKKEGGLMTSEVVKLATKQIGDVQKGETTLATTILDNQTATQKGISIALTLGARALEELLADPAALAKLSPAQRAKLLFDAMKAQDSRIKAIRTIREDNRDQQKFDHAFSGAAY